MRVRSGRGETGRRSVTNFPGWSGTAAGLCKGGNFREGGLFSLQSSEKFLRCTGPSWRHVWTSPLHKEGDAWPVSVPSLPVASGQRHRAWAVWVENASDPSSHPSSLLNLYRMSTELVLKSHSLNGQIPIVRKRELRLRKLNARLEANRSGAEI